MPFDVREFPAGAEADARNRRAVALWLFALCGMILGMIALGGATRLTGSGLSIMEWAPIMGALPPLSDAEWQRLYALYQRIPQYELVNQGFGLDGFKHIFWLEWAHRLWGRLIGLVFVGPLIWLWARGAIPRRMLPRLGLLFLLGGLQGAVGWFMVASGFFPDSTAVAPERLVAHLALALLLYSALLWTGLSTLRPVPDAPPRGLRRWLGGTVALLALTIVAGGFVAGNHAGLIDNTFPLMEGRIVPPDYAHLSPFLLNWTHNPSAVQWNHRLLASLTVLAVAATVAVGLHRGARGRLRGALLAMGGVAVLQYALGVTTLLWAVPAGLATLHQATAALLLTAALVGLHAARSGRGLA